MSHTADQTPHKGERMTDEYWCTLLRTVYGYPAFRPGQLEALRSISTKQDTVAILPTSAGKSLIYCLAAYHFRMLYPTKFIVVVSPLISLMEDQVLQAPAAVPCTLVGTAQDDLAIDQKIWTQNQYTIVFVSPERVQSFAGPDTEKRISLLVVDEAHCIIQDGKSYRPSYLALGEFRRKYLPHTPTLALTATVTVETYHELSNILGMRQPTTIRTSLFRPNLRYEVQTRACRAPPTPLLLRALAATPGRCIVYARTRKECEQLAQALVAEHIEAVAYHAGLDMDVRKRIQASTPRCVVATVSFGMGVNIPNIRLVVHIGIAKSMAAYMQETGRAGRDGAPSHCLLLYHPADAQRLLHMVTEDHERKELRQMDAWAQPTTQCRIVSLLSSFQFSPQDTTHQLPTGPRCRTQCDVCRRTSRRPQQDAPVSTETQQRLLCRAVHQTGNYHGPAFHILYVRGSKDKKVLRFAEMAEPSTTVYGAGRRYTTQDWRAIHNDLVARRFLVQKQTRTGHTIFRLAPVVPLSWYQ
jgi:ATP-dependent DNA helicase RecQ